MAGGYRGEGRGLRRSDGGGGSSAGRLGLDPRWTVGGGGVRRRPGSKTAGAAVGGRTARAVRDGGGGGGEGELQIGCGGPSVTRCLARSVRLIQVYLCFLMHTQLF
jgi:hypothetical protein